MRRLAPLLLLLPSGCSGVQSALDAAGEEAARIETLSWVLFWFCLVVFLGVAAIAAAAIFGNGPLRSLVARERLVMIGGLYFPIISLTLLLIYSIGVMGKDVAPGDPALRVSVSGERWWWRVTYETPDGRRIESANELRLPVGRPVELELTSADVIHSFWVPKLAGKLDMIPGRTNRLTLLASEPGISRGQCAEYCGGAHAFMSFFVIALEPAAFDAWLESEAGPGRMPDEEVAAEGRNLFVETGCGACHTVRGTTVGVIGPDLTHVGSRHSLAAATLPNSAEAFARWIVEGQHIKPENLMPPYGIFTEPELASLAAYLAQLE
jgi:cytochrome c oxidase subunit II